jgi:hypothetical protein
MQSRTVEKAIACIFNRAGIKYSADKITYTGLEALYGSILMNGMSEFYKKRMREICKFRLASYQVLFPKGQKMSEKDFTRRFNLAAAENPNDCLQLPKEEFRQIIRNRIAMQYGRRYGVFKCG